MATVVPGLTCSIAGCDHPEESRDLCKMHAIRWRKYGDPFRTRRIIGDDRSRFWSKVDKSGDCWLWMGARTPLGYGVMRVRGHNTPAHRFSMELIVGRVPGGLEVCHHCDNPPCVRPDHLFVGTHLDNMVDRTLKGKSNPGERNGMARLTNEQAALIRSRGVQAPDGRRATASEFRVAAHTVWMIQTRRTWLDVP